mmetsp:Transcript_52054/g.153541  ORF Transcript_52054/g.153541 Transcript_52054/m.153541 type:complete len:272 (-) Transcript_52054:31-846(-)
MAPTAPFSLKSCTVAEISFLTLSTSHEAFSVMALGTGTFSACCATFSDTDDTKLLAFSVSLLQSRSMRSFVTDLAPSTPALAVLPTMSTASIVASLRAPTAPFSRKSWTVAFHSCFRPSMNPLPSPSAASSAFGSSTPGASTGTRTGPSKPGTVQTARGGSDTPSTCTTVASRMRPSANSSGNVPPACGAPSQRRQASWSMSSSPTSCCTPSQSMPAPSTAMSRASSTASDRAPTTPFSLKSFTVPITSSLRALKRNAMPKYAAAPLFRKW